MRKGINDVTEEQKCKKSYNQHGDQFHCQYVAEILNALEIKQYAIENDKSTRPENNTE
jgi:hypothetical protein